MSNYQSNYTGSNIDNLLGQIKPILFFQNQVVPTNSWVEDTTYENFTYKADITLIGCTASHYPDVVFNLTDATSGLFAPIAISYNGYIRIYANEVPEEAITIPTIKLVSS